MVSFVHWRNNFFAEWQRHDEDPRHSIGRRALSLVLVLASSFSFSSSSVRDIRPEPKLKS